MPKKPQARDEKMSLAEQAQNWLDIVKDDMEMAQISFSKRKYLLCGFFLSAGSRKSIQGVHSGKR